jgi:glycerate-2-kinase
MNRVRKRFTRWGGGQLARGLAHTRVRCFIVSDVIGDDLAAIASGPCVPDPTTAREVRDLLMRTALWEDVGSTLRRHLEATERGEIAETPKPGDPLFDRVENTLIATNRLALDAASRHATSAGLAAEIVETPLVGEAAITGAQIAERLRAERSDVRFSRCLILGGETTVTIRDREAGVGGRCQELALAAARVLQNTEVVLLAAGTDGRDGPTDAAGAIVDGETWKRIEGSGRHPDVDLRNHDSHPALAAADALIKTGPTGTNVMDVVLAIS